MRDTQGNRIGIADIKALALEAETSTERMAEVVNLIHSDDPIVARNAAWVMTHLGNEHIRALLPRQDEFIDLVLSTSNDSLRRLLMNIIERQGIAESDLRTDFLDFCLEHMQLPTDAPGIQSLCMKLAFQQCRYYPELQAEFRNTLLMMQDGYATSLMGLKKKMLNSAFTYAKGV